MKKLVILALIKDMHMALKCENKSENNYLEPLGGGGGNIAGDPVGVVMRNIYSVTAF